MTKEELLKKAYVERDISWMYFNHRILQRVRSIVGASLFSRYLFQ